MTQSTTTEAVGSVPRIRALAGVLSNQIAAGEVVERPASVVKELLENSFDAGARRILVEAEAGGVSLVRVGDDGCGIHAEDLELALSRHATSKIASLSDLERVSSFGFRGEALPSIASVSRLSLVSRTADADSGFEVSAEGAVAEGIRPAALPPGTLVSVRDLFFNTPARRKFLRTERTEYRHLEDVVKRAALSRFDVGLSFRHNGREVFKLSPAADKRARRARVARLLGAAFAWQALEVDIEGPGMTLSGWLGAPDAARAHSDLQYLFINGRAVRDNTARHAVRQAFGERLVSGRHPAYVLYLDLDPSQVDVNVHPAKSEVRFRESRLVHDFLWRGLSRALDEALELSADGDAAAGLVSGGTSAPDAAWRKAATGSLDVAERGVSYGIENGSEAVSPWSASSSPGVARGRSPALVAGRYAVSVDGVGVAIADLARTRRLMIRHQLDEHCRQGVGGSRPLLLPLNRGVAEATADGLASKLSVVSALGFDLRRSAPGSIALRAVPACLGHVPAAALLDTILRWAEGKSDPATESLADALAVVGAERLQDLVDDPQLVSALLRFAEAQTEPEYARLVTRLDAAAIAELMKR
jgi:DNA mismatch repair protein MutL